MSRFPLLSDEVDISKIKISNIINNENKQYCNIVYNGNESLYIQSPVLKFIEPIINQQNSRNNYKTIYLFLTPQDSTTYSFIEFINKIEKYTTSTINRLTQKTLNINSLIKIYESEINEKQRQIYMYLKVSILNQTKIEYNNKNISIDELNKLVRKVNLKLIFEINMIWLSQTKIGIYLKPIRIKAIDIVEDPVISFRDDDSPLQNNLLYTEVDNIHNIINNNFKSLNESIFNNLNSTSEQDSSIKPNDLDSFIKPIEQNSSIIPNDLDSFIKPVEQNLISKSVEENLISKSVEQDSFILSPKQDLSIKPVEQDNKVEPNEPIVDYQKKLQEELFIIDKSNKQDNNKLSNSSSSSIRIDKISRKKLTRSSSSFQLRKKSTKKLSNIKKQNDSLRELKELLDSSDNITSD